MTFIDPADSIERQNEKLLQIAQSLMTRVEQSSTESGVAYQQFERAALLEDQVRERTRELARALDLLQESNARLEEANTVAEAAQANLYEAIESINEGFALFDSSDQLVLFNSRFCLALDDIKDRLETDLSFKDYVALISSSGNLTLPEGETRKEWARKRLGRHRDSHAVFNISLTDDRWLHVSEHRAPGGGTVILQTDVTDIIRFERNERERMRDEQARMLQATLDHLNQGICIFDRNQTLVGWNKRMDRFVTMVRGPKVLAIDFSALFDLFDDVLRFHDPKDAERLKDWVNQDSKRTPLAFEMGRGDSDVLSILAQEMPDQGFVMSFTDVTSERAAARALLEMNEVLERRVLDRTEELGAALDEAERANASKSRFVAAASHDLLQPLSAAKLFVSSLALKETNPEQQSIIEKTETALMGVENIIEALLEISKLDAGKAVFKKQPVRMSDVLTPLRDEMTPMALQKGVSLDVVDCSLTVESDPGYLRRIIQNLLSNAVRYTDTGRVLAGARRQGQHVRIEVWDTGRGIAEEDQAAIFQEFKRLEGSQHDAGLGLGLAIVERACKGLGHAFALSSSPGEGSCFSILVPRTSEKSAPLEVINPSDSASQKPIGGLLALLVENDRSLSSALSMMIEEIGADVLCAHSAEEAVELLQTIQLKPDVLLLDYQLGAGVSGIDLYDRICRDYGHVPAAIVSASRSRGLSRDCKTRGVPLIPKPIDSVRLYEFLTGVHQGLQAVH